MLALITARGGSRGISGKNVRLMAGKPMIAWTIEAALASSAVRRVVVSTDSEQIADVCRSHGAEVPFIRPAELASDTAGSFEVAMHALNWIEMDEGSVPDRFALLQPTSPLRTAEDIDAAARLMDERAADAVIGVTPAPTHPFLCKRELPDGTLGPFIEGATATRRQDLPPAYAVNGAIYIERVAAFLEAKSFYPRRTVGYVMDGSRSIDIDDLWQFDAAEALLARRD